MKIINRYILKEHVGPFVFALSALTSLLLLQYIARKFGDLVGRGLSWQVITEFLLLSVPFTLEETMPMAVLVSVLYAFSRLASENEVTALKAGGVSTRSLMWPSLAWAFMLSLFMVWFNDQLESRANHELATLQTAILRTKPTFALRPQVINNVKEGQLYLRAGTIDLSSDHLHEVTIYDLSDPSRRRTIYADSGILAFAPNRRDLDMSLFSGMIMSAPTDKIGELTRVYYKRDELKVRDVANQFQSIDADTSMKGNREMTVCEMQKQYEISNTRLEYARYDSIRTAYELADGVAHHLVAPKYPTPAPIGGIGALYCTMITKYFHVAQAAAAEVPRLAQDTVKRDTTHRDTTRRDTTRRDTAKNKSAAPGGRAQHVDSVGVMLGNTYVRVPVDKIPPDALYPGGVPAGSAAIKRAADAVAYAAAHPGERMTLPVPPGAPGAPGGAPISPPVNGAAPGRGGPAPVPMSPGGLGAARLGSVPSELAEAKVRLDEARRVRNGYGIEIQKKFSLAAACMVFVLVGAPVALRFPRGGVGLVIGVSFFVFAVYYVGLIGGEALANKNLVSPFWAMWVDNILFLVVGLLLITRMGKEGVTNRGGRLGELVDSARDWFGRRAARSAQ